jgi:protein TonB
LARFLIKSLIMETRNVLFEKKYLNIIFDNRNKEYGAYQLRMEYEKNIAIALFSSILLLYCTYNY